MALDSTSSSSATYSPFARSLLNHNKMSITQTYHLAHSARVKLSREAARADHDLRLLVGHANLLDSLMLDLANAEKEQERWFNNTVRNASKLVKQPTTPHIRWADTVEEESIEDYDDDSDLSDDDSDSEYDEEELQMAIAASPALIYSVQPEEQDDEQVADDEEEEEAARLTLTRTPSRQQSPPELLDDESSSESEEDSMPPSPTNIPIDTFVSADDHPAKRTANHLTVFDQPYMEPEGTMIPAY